jgi:hypothetical protein
MADVSGFALHSGIQNKLVGNPVSVLDARIEFLRTQAASLRERVTELDNIVGPVIGRSVLDLSSGPETDTPDSKLERLSNVSNDFTICLSNLDAIIKAARENL